MSKYIQVYKAESVSKGTACYKQDFFELTEFLNDCEVGKGYYITIIDMPIDIYRSLPEKQRF